MEDMLKADKNTNGKCKLCGADIANGQEYCHSCIWRAKWPDHVINSPELETRRKRSHNLKIISIDRDKGEAVFESRSILEGYKTNLRSCTCTDFAMAHGARPCKHIFRLAEELGLLQCEEFQAGEHDYTIDIPARNELLPEPLQRANSDLIEKYISILYFIIKGCKKERGLWNGDKRGGVERSARSKYKTLEDALIARKKLNFPNERDELLDALEELGVIETLSRGNKRVITALSELMHNARFEMNLAHANAIIDAFRGTYPKFMRSQVTEKPISLINSIEQTLRRSEYIIRPCDAEDTSDWAFYVPDYFNDALDIKLVLMRQNLVDYAVWTQGINFAFEAGDMIYKDAAKYYKGKPALQVKDAKPASGMIETRPLTVSDAEQSKEDLDLITEDNDEEEKTIKVKVYDPGYVKYLDFKTDVTRETTQFDFVKMLIGGKKYSK